MKSLKLFAATALLLATGVGFYTGNEIMKQDGDRQSLVSDAPSKIQVTPVPTVTVDVQIQPNSNPVVDSVEATPKPSLFQLTVDPVDEGTLDELEFSLVTPNLAKIDGPAVSNSTHNRAVGPGLFSLATSTTFFVPKTSTDGDRTSSADTVRSFDVMTFGLDALTPPSSVGSAETAPDTTSLTPPPASSTTEPFVIELLKPTSPDPLSTAKGPDTSVPEPGTVAGLLIVGVLGAGSLAKRKLAKRFSEQQ